VGIAVVHLGGHQVGAGLLQRRRHGDVAVEVVLARLQVERPLGGLGADVLLLALGDEAVAEVFDVHLLPLQLRRVAFEVGLEVGEQLRDLDGVSGELDPFTVAEAVFECRPLAGGLRDYRFKTAPVADDLRELVAVMRGFRRQRNQFFPQLGRARILPPVLELRRQGRLAY
jgi:hypothetical protein